MKPENGVGDVISWRSNHLQRTYTGKITRIAGKIYAVPSYYVTVGGRTVSSPHDDKERWVPRSIIIPNEKSKP